MGKDLFKLGNDFEEFRKSRDGQKALEEFESLTKEAETTFSRILRTSKDSLIAADFERPESKILLKTGIEEFPKIKDTKKLDSKLPLATPTRSAWLSSLQGKEMMKIELKMRIKYL